MPTAILAVKPFQRYGQFIRERFPLGAHLPLIISFTWGNLAVAGAALATEPSLARGLLATLVLLLFFFRLRLFDELKDLEYDRSVNPTRPLVRGLISKPEAQIGIVLALSAELTLVALLACAALPAYLLALAFSALMYKEFYVGRLIRPHITTYAVLHTFVAVLLGYTAATVTFDLSLYALPKTLMVFGMGNWLLFNVFEFARKTMAVCEERQGVETYSSKFKAGGAAALTASQIILLLGLAAALSPLLLTRQQFLLQVLIAVLPLSGMAVYLTLKTARSARSYRSLTGCYLIAAYLVLALTRL